MSARQYAKGNRQQHATYLVCRKALALCRDQSDRTALIHRVRYELRHAALSGDTAVSKNYWSLLDELHARRYSDLFWYIMSSLRVPVAPFWRLYLRGRYGQ